MCVYFGLSLFSSNLYYLCSCQTIIHSVFIPHVVRYMKSTKLSVLSGINRNKHEQGEEVGMIIMMTMIMMKMDG
jgi:hypothetical protein